MDSTKPQNAGAGAQPHFQISRRSFLRNCTVAAAMTGLPLWFIERQQARAEEERATRRVLSPNDRPRLALIGCGGMGRADGQIATEFGDIVAVCDVDDDHRVAAVEQFTLDGRAPAAYADFRKLLERDDVDGIINVTPDHWHTLINIGAARAGKDIYSEKPLTLTVDEGRHVIRAVRENNVILQTGTQQRSNHRFRLACELVRNGRLGQLQRANVWLPAGLREGPFSTARVPAGLNWDFWQGPAPAMEYVPERCHTKFRYWYEYSGGTMTDWGAHHNDIAYWAVGLIAPRDVIARPLSEPVPGGYTAFADYEVHYRYDNGVELNIQTTRDDNIYGEKDYEAGTA
ncbi:MAG: Gfo/Idh/MocA family oxidoreductase [Opitutus sp.]|nr:Gfo/Idh/MocA family oxidoreductase [Opitutus sp.]